MGKWGGVAWEWSYRKLLKNTYERGGRVDFSIDSGFKTTGLEKEETY